MKVLALTGLLLLTSCHLPAAVLAGLGGLALSAGEAFAVDILKSVAESLVGQPLSGPAPPFPPTPPGSTPIQ